MIPIDAKHEGEMDSPFKLVHRAYALISIRTSRVAQMTAHCAIQDWAETVAKLPDRIDRRCLRAKRKVLT